MTAVSSHEGEIARRSANLDTKWIEIMAQVREIDPRIAAGFPVDRAALEELRRSLVVLNASVGQAVLQAMHFGAYLDRHEGRAETSYDAALRRLTEEAVTLAEIGRERL